MSDPFETLNPIASKKSAADKALCQPPQSPVDMKMSSGFATPATNGYSGMGMMTSGPQPIFNYGGMMPHGGVMPHNSMMTGQFVVATGTVLNSNQTMHPSGQQAPMYDNIRKLLEKKPVVDELSMDFLENLGGAKASDNFVFESVQAPVNHSEVSKSSADLDFGFLAECTQSPSASVHPMSPASGTKSSALAVRLAHGKRPTQEDARKNLGFKAGAFSSSGHAKISLKSVAGGTAVPASSGEPTVDDFVAGNASLAPIDDIFAASPVTPIANSATSSSNDTFW
ncbi:hypothetical protein Plhal304r1_c007g0030041 [Plasmopara halstedii]